MNRTHAPFTARWAALRGAATSAMMLASLAAFGHAADGPPNPSQADPYVQEWSFDKPGAVWLVKGTCTSKEENGVLTVHSTGADPELVSPERSPDLTLDMKGRTLVLKFRMRSNSSGVGQICWAGGVFYAGQQYHNFTSGHPSTFAAKHDGQWHEYEVEVPAVGRLDYLRLTPSTGPGDIDFSWIRMTVSPTPSPHIPVSIHGILLDEGGKPINEGFVMMKGNPQLNALTGSDGRFQIDGDAFALPDVLLASWSGCEVAQLTIDKPTRSDVKIQLRAQDPEFTRIETGLSLTLRWFPPYESSRPLTHDQRQCMQSYEAFLGQRGEAIIAKMLADTALTDDEQRYEYLLAAEIGKRAWQPTKTAEAAYTAHVRSEFYRISFKAICRHQLSDDDVHALRLMDANYGCTGFLATGNEYYGGMGTYFPPVAPGEALPFDIPLLRSSPLYQAPGWTNRPSLSATSYLRLEGLWSYFDSYWKWRIQDDGCLVQTPPEDWKKKYWQEYYQVTSLKDLVHQAKGKPVYLTCQNYEDATGFGFSSRQAEYFRRAYRGAVDVYQVSQTTDTAYVDIFADEWSTFGPNPKSQPLLGRDNPRWEDKNFTPFRHARMDKICLMTVPFPSGEVLLDGTTRFGSFLANKLSLDYNLILDGDGKIATPVPGGDFMSLSCRFYPSYGIHTSYERMGEQDFWYALVYEQIFRELIAHGGKWLPTTYDHVRLQYPSLFHLKDDLFIITSIDKEHGLIHAGWLDPGKARFVYPDGGGHPALDATNAKGDFLFKVGPGTRYEVRFNGGTSTWLPWGSESEPPKCVYKVMARDAFKPGDHFFATVRLPELSSEATVASLLPRYMEPYCTNEEVIKEKRPLAFDMAKYDGKELPTERIMNFAHSIMYNGTNTRYMPLYGSILKKEGTIITVGISADEVKSMWGYRFSKEEELKGRSLDQMPSAYWATIKRWAEGTEADRTYRFNVDGATDTYRNGLVARSDELAVGDSVYIEYERWWETQQLQKEIIFPERLQASAPMATADGRRP